MITLKRGGGYPFLVHFIGEGGKKEKIRGRGVNYAGELMGGGGRLYLWATVVICRSQDSELGGGVIKLLGCGGGMVLFL